MKSKLLLLAICLLSFLTSCIQKTTDNQDIANDKNQKAFETEIQDIADDTNKKLPMMVDSETRWDNVSVHPGKIYQYNYTLIKVVKENFDIHNFEENQKTKFLSGIEQMSKDPGFKFFRNNNVTFSYSYRDKNGDQLLKLLFGPNDYR